MTEREIIIEGLERRQRFKTPDGSSCVIPANLLQDALALLKAQEPRVMTPEEAAALPEGEVAWFEEKYEKTGLSYIQPMMSNGAGMMIGPYLTVAPARMARRGLRFWTEKPDEKRREAEPWASDT